MSPARLKKGLSSSNEDCEAQFETMEFPPPLRLWHRGDPEAHRRAGDAAGNLRFVVQRIDVPPEIEVEGSGVDMRGLGDPSPVRPVDVEPVDSR